jgi:hypothetical protein
VEHLKTRCSWQRVFFILSHGPTFNFRSKKLISVLDFATHQTQEHSMKSICISLLAICLLLAPASAFSELPEQLLNDFSPLEGYVVMPIEDDQFLIDLDASKGARTGDIFSIIRTGEKITHPVSGEIIGSLDGSKAYLQVTRLKSGYSYVQKIGGSGEINKGDRIIRFDSVPALFSNKSHNSSELRTELQSKLNRLDWLSDQAGNASLLIFERDESSLRVKNPEGKTLFSYPMIQDMPVSDAEPKTGAVPAAAPISIAVPATNAPEQGIIQNRTDTTQIWHGAEHKDEVVGLRVDDFNSDGVQETALLLHKSLVIGSYNGKQRTELTRLALKGNLAFLAIDSMDLNGNGRPEIFLSAARNGIPASRVYELEGNRLVEIARDIPMLFERIEHPQQGPLLLGQKNRDPHAHFSEKPFRVAYSEASYVEGTIYPLPHPAIIYGSTAFIDGKGALRYAHLSGSDFLKIKSSTGEELFESPDRYGGSEVILKSKGQSNKDESVNYFLPQKLLVVNNELLALQNDGRRISQNLRHYKKSRLISLKWNGLALEENWRTSDQSGHTADFAHADIDNDGQNELVLAVKFSRKGIFSTAKSAIVVYEMK